MSVLKIRTLADIRSNPDNIKVVNKKKKAVKPPVYEPSVLASINGINGVYPAKKMTNEEEFVTYILDYWQRKGRKKTIEAFKENEDYYRRTIRGLIARKDGYCSACGQRLPNTSHLSSPLE